MRITNLVVMSSIEEYKNLRIKALASEYFQGLLHSPNRISYETFFKS